MLFCTAVNTTASKQEKKEKKMEEKEKNKEEKE